MYAIVFTVVMVFAVHLVDSFSLFCFWDVLERLGCLGMFWDVLERHALDLN